MSLDPGPRWDTPAAQAAARIVYLLAGVSYYKTAAPPVIDLGDTALTGRERQVSELIAEGLSSQEIAGRLGITRRTAESHAEHIMTKLGVRTRAQVAAFTIANPIPADNLRRAVNRLLPPAIRVLDAIETEADFHPRFDAVAKTYQYTIHRALICSPFEWRYVHHYPYPLDEGAMTAAAGLFEGEHDFKAFAASDEAAP